MRATGRRVAATLIIALAELCVMYRSAAAAELPPPAKPQTTEPLLDPAPEVAAAPDPVTIAPEPVTEPEPVEEPETAALPPSEILPDTGLNEPIAGVTTGRLPSIGAEVAPAAEAVDAPETTPLQQFARSFNNPGGKPLFAIILLDSGAADLDRAQLAALPFPEPELRSQ